MADRFEDFEKIEINVPLSLDERTAPPCAPMPPQPAPCIKPKPPKRRPKCLKPFIPKKPYEEYNAEGQLIGYWWGYGDTIDLEFCLSGYVIDDEMNTYMTVRDFVKDKHINFSLYNFRHEELLTKVYEGSDYQIPTYSEVYNITPITEGVFYVYTPSEVGGTYTRVILPQDYQVDTRYYIQDDVKVVFGIDSELAKTLVRGTYYCSLTITTTNNDFAQTVFYQDSSTFTIR